MAILLPNRARQELARTVFRDIVNSKDFWYVFASRANAWNDEDVPPALLDTWDQVLESQRDMLLARRVRPVDVVFLARRIDWVSGTVYDRYDSQTVLESSDFYVMTEDYRVYKCLNNNEGAPSTVKPTIIDPIEPERPADGYVWKFMFEIPSQDRVRFLNELYIPVRYFTAEIDFDTNAFVSSVSVENGGAGYTEAYAYIEGDGTGAVLDVTIQDGYISDITVVQQGYGYSYANVKIIGTGTGASATVELMAGDLNEAFGYAANAQVASEGSLGGAIFAVEIVDGGHDYVLGETTVVIAGDGQDAVVTVTGVENGAVTAVSVASEGSDYTIADLVVTGQTTGYGAVLRPIISPQGGHGSHAPKELCATTLGIAVELSGDAEELFYSNEFRQVGLIKNLKQMNSNQLFTADVGTPCYVANVSDMTEFTVGDTVTTNDGGLFRVVRIVTNETTEDIWLVGVYSKINVNSSLSRDVAGAPAIAINTLTEPEFDKLSGEVMYLNNRLKVTRVVGQDEVVQVFLRF